MTQKSRDIAAAIAGIFSISVFFVGTFEFQKYHAFDMALGNRIYFVCGASAAYALFLALFIVARGKLLKAVSSTGCSISVMFLYNELMYGNKAWNEFHYVLIGLIALNYLLFYFLIDRIKKAQGYGT